MNIFDIVIVNWNSGTQLKECMQSIEKAKKDNCKINKVIVVDNASSDNSLNDITIINLQIEIIRNNENLGFGKACNIGAANLNNDFVLFLNPDTIIYENTFINLFSYIEENNSEHIGIYGIQLQDENKIVQRTCARFPTMWSFIIRSIGLNKINNNLFKSYTMHEWDHLKSEFVDQVIGAFFMIKHDLYIQLNGFDQRYFVYYEELDFSKRASLIGYKTKYVVKAQAYHKGGGISDNVKAKRLFYNLQSRIIYSFKHFGVFRGIIIMLVTMIIEPFSRFFLLVSKGKIDEIPELIHGYKDIFLNIFTIIGKGLKK
jgi:N-acetylglucosaminyl-diphospho-decaprenol L-rhamnosyltransferase